MLLCHHLFDTHIYSFFLVAKLLYSYATLASFPLQFYVPMDFLEPPIYEKMKLGQLMYYFPRHHNKVKIIVQLVFRTSIVLLTGECFNTQTLTCKLHFFLD